MWHRRPVLAIACLSLLIAGASDAMAQRRAEARVAASREVQLETPPAVATKRASIGKHILVGSLIGAAATIGAIWYTVARHPDEECMACPVAFATIVVGGAVVGGVVGAVVYAARDPAQH